MSVFIGEYRHHLDDKSRMIIPARFREGLGDRCVVTKGMDESLFLYPLPEWERIEERLRSLSFAKREVRAFVRMFFSGAVECGFDRQGRIILPQGLLRHARLRKEAVIIGVSTRVEIWARETWEAYLKTEEVHYDNLAETLAELDLEI